MQALEDDSILVTVKTPADFEAFGGLCRDYVEWCRERYRDMPWFVEEVFGYQALEDELEGLPQKYGQPAGCTMLVRGDQGVVAGGAYRRLSTRFVSSSAFMWRMGQKAPVWAGSYRTP